MSDSKSSPPEDDTDIEDLIAEEEKEENKSLKSAMDKLANDQNNQEDLVTLLPGARRSINIMEFICAYISLFILNKPKVAFGLMFTFLLVLIIAVNLKLKNAPDPSPESIIEHDYSKIRSKYELTAGKIDHWCLQGGDQKCRCEDPLHPAAKLTFPAWKLSFEANKKLVSQVVDNEEDVDVAFIGENVVEKWAGRTLTFNSTYENTVKQKFSTFFDKEAGAKCSGIPLGLTGDTVSNVLYRIQNGEMSKKFNPKIWWIILGTNDLGIRQCSEEVVLVGILRIIEEILDKKPDAKIVVNSILPMSSDLKQGRVPRVETKDRKKVHTSSIGMSNRRLELRHARNRVPVVRARFSPLHWVSVSMWPSVEALNYALKKFCDEHDKKVEFFDAYDIFVEEEDEKSTPNIIKDYYQSFRTAHLTPAGHQEFLARIHEKVKSILHKQEKKEKKAKGEDESYDKKEKSSKKVMEENEDSDKKEEEREGQKHEEKEEGNEGKDEGKNEEKDKEQVDEVEEDKEQVDEGEEDKEKVDEGEEDKEQVDGGVEDKEQVNESEEKDDE